MCKVNELIIPNDITPSTSYLEDKVSCVAMTTMWYACDKCVTGITFLVTSSVLPSLLHPWGTLHTSNHRLSSRLKNTSHDDYTLTHTIQQASSIVLLLLHKWH